MSIVAFTFGSFGDILSIVDLAVKIRKALGDGAGSSKDYQALLLELDSFSDVLNSLHNAIHSHHKTQKLSGSVEQAIRNALNSARELLGEFYASISSYKGSLREGGSGSVILDSWWKIGWSLFKKEEVVEMRRRLKDQVERLNALLSVSQWTSLRRLEETSKRHHLTLAQVSRQMERLPPKLGHTWEGESSSSIDRLLLLTDMLGQTISLPIELCATRELFDNLLKLYFADRAGESFVERGDYDITISDDISHIAPIKSAQWGDVVKPGTALAMNAILRREKKHLCYCPCCTRVIESGSMEPGSSIRCTYCSAWLTVSRSEQPFLVSIDIECNGQLVHCRKPPNFLANTTPRSPFPVTVLGGNEIQFLRRIHVTESVLVMPLIATGFRTSWYNSRGEKEIGRITDLRQMDECTWVCQVTSVDHEILLPTESTTSKSRGWANSFASVVGDATVEELEDESDTSEIGSPLRENPSVDLGDGFERYTESLTAMPSSSGVTTEDRVEGCSSSGC